MQQVEELSDTLLSQKGYAFKVELADKVLFFDCPTALHCWKWVEMLRKSKRTYDEMNRTKNKMITKQQYDKSKKQQRKQVGRAQTGIQSVHIQR